MKKMLLSAAAVLGLMAGAAQAVTYTVDVTAATVTNPNLGLSASARILSDTGPQTFNGATYSFDLINEGDSATIDVFALTSFEPTLDANDTNPLAASAVFDFGGSIGAITLTGITAGVLGPVPGGLATFISDAIRVSPTLAIVISIADTAFATDGTGYVFGNAGKGNVTATFTLAAVPLPATLPMALLALGGLAAVARRRKAV